MMDYEYKGEIIKFEDTNLANLGTELEKSVKLAAAQTEEQWYGVGQEPGLIIWRIEKFKVVPWPKEEYGSFFSGDSYIILHTFLKNEVLHWNAHMWVGTFTTKDEAGTAAYKIVELDDFFHRQIVLHREVQGYESNLFLSYFGHLHIMDGGIETGFKKVPVESYRPRLLHIRGKGNNFRIAEVALNRSSLNSGDVFILDNGLTIFGWVGKQSNHFEKFKVSALCQSMKAERNSIPHIVHLDEGEEENESETGVFWTLLGGKGTINPATVRPHLVTRDPKMLQLSDATGDLVLSTVPFGRNSLVSDNVFIIDIGTDIFIWIGKNASQNEKCNSLSFAHKYIRQFSIPLFTPVSSVPEGRESLHLNEVLGGRKSLK